MADYKNIKGFNIQYLDSDPPNPIEGQMWFNSTSQTLKGAEAGGIAVGTWASGVNMNTARASGFSGGTQTALLAATGDQSPAVESYNGTSWTEVGDVNQARTRGTNGGAGTSTSSIIAGGAYTGGPLPLGMTALSETWNGTSWTEGNDLNQGRGNAVMFGTSVPTASYATGFYNYPPVTPTNLFEQYNGTSWTTSTAVNTSRIAGAATGTGTDAIINSGAANPYPNPVSATELWNGSTWTTSTNSNSIHQSGNGAGASSTEALIFGGESPSGNQAITEYWNGTSWTELNDLANLTRSAFSGQSSGVTSAIAAGGLTGAPQTPTTITEEWTVPEYVVKTFTTS